MDIKYSHMNLHNKAPAQAACAKLLKKPTANKHCRGWKVFSLCFVSTCLWQPSTIISFCCGEVLAKTISVWYFRMSSSCSAVKSFRSPPWTTQALASLKGKTDVVMKSHEESKGPEHNHGALHFFLYWYGDKLTLG